MLAARVLSDSDAYTCFDAGDPVTHWVKARLCGASFDYGLEFGLAALEFCAPVVALRHAVVHHERFRIHASIKHIIL